MTGTQNIDKFLVGVTEALCHGGFLANSGLAPGLHRAAYSTSRPTSASSIASAANPQLLSGTGASVPNASAAASGVASKGGGGGGGGSGGGDGGRGAFSEADVSALRGAATSLARKNGNIGLV